MISPCSICPRKYRPLAGNGPQPSPILCIGERPGQNENKWGRVFIGKAGMEFDETYLPLAHLHRPDIRVTNTVQCWAEGNRTPTDKEIAACAGHHLPSEIEATRPDIIILMGGSACQLVPSIKLDTMHGIPQHARLYDWEGLVVPMYHPALGLHEGRWMTYLLEDWEELGRMLKEQHFFPRYPSRPTLNPDYQIARSYHDLAPLTETDWVSIDTEDHAKVPYSVQVSNRAGYGLFIPAHEKGILHRLHLLLIGKYEAVFHHAAHDLDVLQKLGVEPTRWRDTMQEAYHLGNVPQGLKPLVYRLFGFTMTSWEDVVRPYSLEALLAWVVEAEEIAKLDLSLIDVKRLKTKIREITKRGPLEQLLSRLVLNINPETEYDPWERLDEYWRDDAHSHETSHIEARLGPYPILGIANAPLDKAVQYSCGDADWTGQVAQELARRRGDKFWKISSEDIDQ